MNRTLVLFMQFRRHPFLGLATRRYQHGVWPLLVSPRHLCLLGLAALVIWCVIGLYGSRRAGQLANPCILHDPPGAIFTVF